MKKKFSLLLSIVFALSFGACTLTPSENAGSVISSSLLNSSSQPSNHPKCSFEYETYGVGVEKSVATNLKGILKSDTVVYSSSDTDSVTVDENGLITGIADGSATITAEVKDVDGNLVQTLNCNVEVNAGEYQTLNGEETFVKWEGRNFFYAGAMNCFNTAGGFEVKFYGTQFKVTALANGGTTRLSVLIDKESDPTANLVRLSNDSTNASEYVLAQGLEEGYHTIRVYKTSAATTSSLAFTAMETDGFFWAKPKEKDLKIEVYGDSITVGACNMRTTAEDGDNDKDNGCYTYAWLAAEEVGADINVIARSGIGMVYSWGSEYFMSDAYKQTYCSESDYFGYRYNPAWDFSNYIPDVVVINIGTNDAWQRSGFQEEAFISSLTDMCNDLTDKYGKEVAFIFCYGMMTAENKDALKTVAQNIENSLVLELPKSKTGHGNHPLAAEHAEAAEVLAEALEEYF